MVKISCSSMTSEGVGINPQVNQMRSLESIPFPELASRTSQFPSGMSQFCQSESCFWPSPWRQNWYIPFAELLGSLARFHTINGKHPWFLKKNTNSNLLVTSHCDITMGLSLCYHPLVLSSADQSLLCDMGNQWSKTHLDWIGFVGSMTTWMREERISTDRLLAEY